MNRRRLRLGGMIAATALGLSAIGLWWSDGAWDNGAMPTHGMAWVTALGAGGLLCLLAATWLDRQP